MEKLIPDVATLAKLTALEHSVEFCDQSGRTIGWFLPVGAGADYEGYECPLSSEELERIEREGGGRPLAGILRDLEIAT